MPVFGRYDECEARSRTLVYDGINGLGPQRSIGDVLERYGHLLAGAINCDMPEELETKRRREVLSLRGACSFLKNDLQAKRAIHAAGSPGPCMNRTRNEFPEWLKIVEHRVVRIKIMRGGVMQVGGKPNGIANPGLLQSAANRRLRRPGPSRHRLRQQLCQVACLMR